MDSTALAAWTGAASGVLALGWQVIDRFASRRPRLRLHGVDVSQGVIGAIDRMPITAETFEVQVVNRGTVTVTVDRVSVERPLPVRARFVEMWHDGEGHVVLQDGEAARYRVAMDALEDDEVDRMKPIKVHVHLASGDVFVSTSFALRWSMAEGPPRPELQRVRNR